MLNSNRNRTLSWYSLNLWAKRLPLSTWFEECSGRGYNCCIGTTKYHDVQEVYPALIVFRASTYQLVHLPISIWASDYMRPIPLPHPNSPVCPTCRQSGTFCSASTDSVFPHLISN
ncbi:hypothetical protein EG68_11628 [Paragonimus skrjabini miyazakii]|uniref:Uncharacterized protein n=1 Tax=Paragonimus skrjabini miyazakii TaxID=59628 RepID=A0A8S9YFU5_9TREM|nr:hypothetical protein EG68_11628 [Paragonimus skrjabini miyazakii]